MIHVKRLVLDVLKPHQPNALEFCSALAAAGGNCRVCLTVLEMDEKTETLQLTVEGRGLDFDVLQACIVEQGGSLHSIDEVEVEGGDD